MLRIRTIALLFTSIAIAAGPATKPTTPPATRPGTLRFHFKGDASQWPADKREAIEKAMTEAAKYYNEVGGFDFDVPTVYSAGTPTADANYYSQIRFGGQIGTRTALHELGHVFGAGTHRNWQKLIKDGKWTGAAANAQLKEFDGPDAVLHADRMHFWPYGLNFDSEGRTPDMYRKHVKMVAAFMKDLDAAGPTTRRARQRDRG